MHRIATTTPDISKPISSTNPPGPGLRPLDPWLGSTPDLARPRLPTRSGPSSWLGSARLDSTSSSWPPALDYSGFPPHDDIPRYSTAAAVALAIAFQALQAIQASKLSKLLSSLSSPHFPSYSDSKVYPSFLILQDYSSPSDFQSLPKLSKLPRLFEPLRLPKSIQAYPAFKLLQLPNSS